MNTPEHYLQMLRRMKTEQIMELLHALASECASRDPATSDHCAIASCFTGAGVGLYEQGGCHVEIEMSHPAWDSIYLYTTVDGSKYLPIEPEVDDDDFQEEYHAS